MTSVVILGMTVSLVSMLAAAARTWHPRPSEARQHAAVPTRMAALRLRRPHQPKRPGI